jgi:hypothetical protein
LHFLPTLRQTALVERKQYAVPLDTKAC